MDVLLGLPVKSPSAVTYPDPERATLRSRFRGGVARIFG
jgi:hypothetical protein